MGLAILAGVLVAVAFAASPALAAGPPKFLSLETFEIHATRASVSGFFLLDGSASPTGVNGSETQWRIEYATSEAGPWIIAGSGTSPPGPAANAERGGVELTHLTPRTSYVTRMVLENGSGNATETARFTTTSVGAPEFLRPSCGSEGSLTFLQQEAEHPPNMCGELRVTFADLLAGLDAAGSETEYQFEYGLGENGPWTPVAGASGHVTVAEDHADVRAHVTGLSPETTYYVRVVATNSVGTSSGVVTFPTFPAHPQADINGVNAVTAGSAHVLGGVNPDESETQWSIEYATAAAGPWTIVPGGEGTIPAAEGDTAFHPVAGDLTGLSAATPYYVRVLAQNAHGSETSSIESFETSGPPAAQLFSKHGVIGQALLALGSVTDRGYKTHYHFEYVTQSHFETEGFANAASTKVAEIEGGNQNRDGRFTAVVVSGEFQATPASAYHVRLVASNQEGTVVEGDQIIVAPSAPPREPASCGNEALRVGPSSILPDCRAYEQVTPVQKGSQDLFSLLGADHLTPAASGERAVLDTIAQLGSNPGSEAHVVSTQYVLTRTPSGWQLQTTYPAEPGHTAYGAEIFNPELTELGVQSSNFTTLFEYEGGFNLLIGQAGGPYASVASNLAVDNKLLRAGQEGTRFWGADKDFQHVLFGSTDKSLASAASGSGEDARNLYEFAEGKVQIVNVDESGALIDKCGATLGFGRTVEANLATHAISNDAKTIFFTSPDPDYKGAEDCGPTELYMREGSKVVDVSAPEPGMVDPTGRHPVEYRGAAADGSRVFFTTTTELTRDDEGIHDEELYEYDTVTGKLTRISRGESGTAAAAVQSGHAGQPMAISEDGSTVYFQSQAKLTSEAPEGSGANLYRYVTATGATEYVTTLGEIIQRDANETTPNGRFLLFHDGVVAGFEEHEQLYRYDSVDKSLTCVSCSPAATGVVEMPTDSTAGTDALRTPTETPAVTAMSADGSYVFFATTAALVPQDVNEAPDVYEWHDGAVSLLSAGHDPTGSQLLGQAANGRDVFFTSHAQLSPWDTDQQGDAYDARIGGGMPPPPPTVAPCEGDACLIPVASPIDVTPASLTFHSGATVAPSGKTHTVKSKPKRCRVRHVITARRRSGRTPKSACKTAVAIRHGKSANRHARRSAK